MFALLKQHHKPERAVKQVYGGLLEHIRNPVFYESYGVKDDFEGRFDLLLLHVFLVINRLKDKDQAFNQALFDTMFGDMDQTLREMGIGDMGIPKHMRRMMKAFNGRAHAYEAGLKDGNLAEALKKNLYGEKNRPATSQLEKMTKYIMDQAAYIAGQNADDILGGVLKLKEADVK